MSDTAGRGGGAGGGGGGPAQGEGIRGQLRVSLGEGQYYTYNTWRGGWITIRGQRIAYMNLCMYVCIYIKCIYIYIYLQYIIYVHSNLPTIALNNNSPFIFSKLEICVQKFTSNYFLEMCYVHTLLMWFKINSSMLSMYTLCTYIFNTTSSKASKLN